MWLCIDATLLFNQYINPIVLDNIGWKYYISTVCGWASSWRSSGLH
ncbi:hypothetical protein EYZ11_006429 [Aspergillus tanneri]|uniref:Uncharacterized protein n=1 Tax=Aspergillus tanneri TaxID=1220188 RepID=A0A4S3JFX4_9EURO|nr:hypothetical protein EYZ11_006429 [Aspergillus tanneri]